jgi:hypothetical protein
MTAPSPPRPARRGEVDDRALAAAIEVDDRALGRRDGTRAGELVLVVVIAVASANGGGAYSEVARTADAVLVLLTPPAVIVGVVRALRGQQRVTVPGGVRRDLPASTSASRRSRPSATGT